MKNNIIKLTFFLLLSSILLFVSCTKNKKIPEKNIFQIRDEKIAKLDMDKLWEEARQNYEQNDTANPLFIHFDDDITPLGDIQEYIPIADHYKTLSVKDFNKDWKYFCVFSLDNMNDEVKKKCEGNARDVCIVRDDFKLIIGLFQKENSETVGAYIAKISPDESRLIQLCTLSDDYNKQITLIDKGDYFWVCLLSGVTADSGFEDISNIKLGTGGGL